LIEERMVMCILRGARNQSDAGEGALGLLLTKHGAMIPEDDSVNQWGFFCPTPRTGQIWLK
jgi:hypothetical protein